jgi:periplasmic divalent cation tolerance protein
VILLYSTFPDLKTAQTTIETLLNERVIACANVHQPSQSYYWWEGKIEQSSEVTVWLKLPVANKTKAEQRLRELHPYEIPCMLFLKPDSCNSDYLAWVTDVTEPIGTI